MLSRIAESLFWIGRYVERSDGTSRILDVHLQLLLEDPWIDEDTACRSLLAVMGTKAVPGTTLTRESVVNDLAIDRNNPGSIAFAIVSARENARRAREVVSTELWECLNTTHSKLPKKVSAEKTHNYFTWVRERSALAFGIVDSATSHDEAWQFFTLGRALERADMTARLLETRSLTDATGPSWITILRSCGAYEAYLRTYRGVPSTRNAGEFLLKDQLFPRSILYSVMKAEKCLREIDPGQGRAGVVDEAQRLLGSIRSEFEFRPINELLDNLPAHMEQVQAVTGAASEAIRLKFFPTIAVSEWIEENS